MHSPVFKKILPSRRLEGTVALITGGGTGIGRGLAETFAEEGAQVAVMGRRMERLRETVTSVAAAGGEALAMQGDVCSSTDCERVVESVLHKWGELDILVNNAGMFLLGAPEEFTDESYERQMGVNVKGAFYMMRACTAALERSSGCILNIGSAVVRRPIAGESIYIASKHAIAGLTRAWAADLAERGIRVNCIHPGVVQSEIAEAAGLEVEDPAAVMEALAALHPIGRYGQPADVAAAAAFLCSSAASWITGAELDVDGGFGLGVVRMG